MPMSERSKDEVRKLARTGGINSGKTRRKQKALKEIFKTLLDEEVTDNKGNKKTVKEVGAIKIVQEYLKGDFKAFELVRDMIGEKPADKVIVAEVAKALALVLLMSCLVLVP